MEGSDEGEGCEGFTTRLLCKSAPRSLYFGEPIFVTVVSKFRPNCFFYEIFEEYRFTDLFGGTVAVSCQAEEKGDLLLRDICRSPYTTSGFSFLNSFSGFQNQQSSYHDDTTSTTRRQAGI